MLSVVVGMEQTRVDRGKCDRSVSSIELTAEALVLLPKFRWNRSPLSNSTWMHARRTWVVKDFIQRLSDYPRTCPEPRISRRNVVLNACEWLFFGLGVGPGGNSSDPLVTCTKTLTSSVSSTSQILSPEDPTEMSATDTNKLRARVATLDT